MTEAAIIRGCWRWRDGVGGNRLTQGLGTQGRGSARGQGSTVSALLQGFHHHHGPGGLGGGSPLCPADPHPQHRGLSLLQLELLRASSLRPRSNDSEQE